jgi:sulfur relay (sulfurtransferase) DsrF/TusC family protein
MHKQYRIQSALIKSNRLEESRLAKKTFEKLFLEAVDEALASLGDSAKQAIYFHLESKFEIKRNQIPESVEDFADGLGKIFGVGAQFLEILIMKKLYERVGQPLEWDTSKELIFIEYVAAARHSFVKERKRSQTSLQE